MMKHGALIFFLFLSFGLLAQKRYDPKEVIDERYGITMYNEMVRPAGGDSVRLCDGSPCGGYIEDYYTNGQMMHKGYYIDGKIRIYRNWYPDGQLERKFMVLDDHKAKLTTYYKGGNEKSTVIYIDEEVREWEDLYENGNTEFEEKYVKRQPYVVYRRFFYEDGTPQDIMEFEKRRKKLYLKTEYFKSGQKKVQGFVVYSEQIMDYAKSGDWKEYNKEGKLIKKTNYIMGQSTNVEKY